MERTFEDPLKNIGVKLYQKKSKRKYPSWTKGGKIWSNLGSSQISQVG